MSCGTVSTTVLPIVAPGIARTTVGGAFTWRVVGQVAPATACAGGVTVGMNTWMVVPRVIPATVNVTVGTFSCWDVGRVDPMTVCATVGMNGGTAALLRNTPVTNWVTGAGLNEATSTASASAAVSDHVTLMAVAVVWTLYDSPPA